MFTIKIPTTHDDFKAYYAVRYKVLSEPWGDPKGTEKDDYEPISEHFMAVNEKQEVVGVVKLYKKDEEAGHVSHLAVAPEYQHKGIGHLLLEAGVPHPGNDGTRHSDGLFREIRLPGCGHVHTSYWDNALRLDGKRIKLADR